MSSALELEGIVGQSAIMHDLSRLVERVANTKATLMIRGESGTGKELIARAIHQLSNRKDSAFVSVDCTNIPANLMESELFGHERGAFTDASTAKKGLLEIAGGGTVLLDEIGLMPLELQAKILNVLETQRFRRVGGTVEIQVDVRFLAATNEDLEAAVRDGRFRDDLYHRLNVVPIEAPPLRMRGEDVRLIADHVLEEYTTLHGTGARRLGESVQLLLSAYAWPGNVRELRHVIERAVLMTDRTVIRADDLIIDRRNYAAAVAAAAAPPNSGIRLDDQGAISVDFPPQGLALEAVERELIRAALEKSGKNVTRAAELLHVSRDTLRYRIGKYGLAAEDAAIDKISV